jgi:hypothetical protein
MWGVGRGWVLVLEICWRGRCFDTCVSDLVWFLAQLQRHCTRWLAELMELVMLGTVN